MMELYSYSYKLFLLIIIQLL